ncbi:class I SAM-dependent DNA methyltransferase [Octadecabacter ascidiaceicola]|uniref:Mg-protoporphyrin IX methyl transferase n=1 Tax=Octadecabacter ascidiaceicola TaxID=1655543 RepID=A0A238JL43_9RHOB|nr:class I SAM-dependent methyltransferase [Octadecabacter ascidiaceicola]SMX31113.1 Mg-protoporphyrin IX methyl transferase [Octadecabacter ascidiaceicola]
MVDDNSKAKIWAPRSVGETRALYADWADTYEDDITAMAYATLDRIAEALLTLAPDLTQPVLDFGCGTGLSGIALKKKGFSTIDGTEISPEMLVHAKEKAGPDGPLYRKLWLGTVGEIDVAPGDYGIIVATGVISLGAAPPDILPVLAQALAPGGLLAFSYNDPTLLDENYMSAFNGLLSDGTASQVFRENGPHLNEAVTGSDVIVLHRT